MKEDKIEVGEYVRTIYGEIFKVYGLIKRDKEHIFVDKVVDRNEDRAENESVLNKNEIMKHSKNIIDLIEVGDYVNGYIVLDVVEDMQTGELHLEMSMDYTNPELGDCTIYNKDIKSIVTKEQFKSVEYRLED